VKLPPIADAYVRGGSSSGTNFGTATSLVVKQVSGTTSDTRITYLRFPLVGLGHGVTSARLRLFGQRPTAGPVTDSVFAVAGNTWSETGINWNNKPALGARQGAPVVITPTAQYYEWDVTAFVQAQGAAKAGAVSFAVRMDANISTSPEAFNSREAADNRPQLVVTSQP
jgi:hypothetical protein